MTFRKNNSIFFRSFLLQTAYLAVISHNNTGVIVLVAHIYLSWACIRIDLSKNMFCVQENYFELALIFLH